MTTTTIVKTIINIPIEEPERQPVVVEPIKVPVRVLR